VTILQGFVLCCYADKARITSSKGEMRPGSSTELLTIVNNGQQNITIVKAFTKKKRLKNFIYAFNYDSPFPCLKAWLVCTAFSLRQTEQSNTTHIAHKKKRKAVRNVNSHEKPKKQPAVS